MAVHQLISRSAPSFARWRPRTRCGARRGFTANCARSVSTSQSARSHVCWTAHTPIAADVEDVSHESPRGSRVDGFLHRADTHWSRPLRGDRAVASSVAASCISTSRSIQQPSGPPNKSSTHSRTTPRPNGCIAIATASTARASGVEWRAWASPKWSQLPASPWQNPYAERVIGSIRRECLDHVIVLNRAHLRRVLTIYSRYYHRSRTHLGLEKDAPDPRPVSATSTGPIFAIPEVGGLHHRYERQAA